MTEYAKRFPLAFGIFTFGVTGLISMLGGSMVQTAILRALLAGAVFWLLGKLLAFSLFYNPATLPEVLAPPLDKTITKKESSE
jgi:hypothetical protein